MSLSLFEGVRRLRDAGLSLIPIKTDGSKAPALPTWKQFERRQANDAELRKAFGNGQRPGIAIIGGAVSGGLEILDHDAPELVPEWRELVDAAAPGLLGRLPQVETPAGGLHVFYRCETIGANQKLATHEVEIASDVKGSIKRNFKHWKIETLIETRGEGGYVVTAGSPVACHSSGKPYKLINGDLKAIPMITPQERDILLSCARSFNQYVKPSQHVAPELQPKAKGLKPGEDFNQRGDVRALLEKHGWRQRGKSSAGERWQRPGGARPSATLFNDGHLYLFSTNAAPFEFDRAYSPFAVCALLEYGGDFQAAAKALAAEGYGEPAKLKSQPKAKQQAIISSEPTTEAEAVADDAGDCPYKANGRGLIWLKPVFDRDSRNDNKTEVLLTNFNATITADIERDDGTESNRVYEITANLAGDGQPRKGMVNAEEFDSLRWLNTILGARAVVYPAKGEHTRVAIRLLSAGIQARRVIAHTGWRDDGEGWRYYHAGGAISSEGLIEAEVELSPQFALCRLPPPPTGARLREVVRAVAFDLPQVAPEVVTLSLLGGAFAAVLTDPDFSLFLVGYTGSGKSELAALVQAFFGSGFNAKTLPAAWSSSANALEAIAHTAKDCVLVIDDFCPLGSAQEQARLHVAADRVFRAQGNHSGRARCRTDGSVRPPKPPRGLAVGTGEDLPRGQSLRARLAILQVEKDAVRWEQLTKCQHQARAGLYAEAMSAFLRWLATDARIGKLRAGASGHIGQLREEWLSSGVNAHKRSATTLAYLQRAWNVWLEFVAECGALDGEEITGLREAVMTALDTLGRAQEGFCASENPATRFVELLQAALASGRAHLTALDGGQPEDREAWGWRSGEAQGDRIGWLEGDNLYLQPDAAFRLAQAMGGNGEGLTITAQTLWKRLKEAGLLASVDEKRDTLKVRRVIGDRSQSVIHLSAKKWGG
ncbi:MAG: bifunctional DNA primase/polymerase [Acidobacteria bacterium]|nr:bifunctional DNA primase/polymerase [Acidobacteriota bacterium]MBI3428018.1 bifunctional DNA primase/polymerase [Acidobacteriota bacterium]